MDPERIRGEDLLHILILRFSHVRRMREITFILSLIVFCVIFAGVGTRARTLKEGGQGSPKSFEGV